MSIRRFISSGAAFVIFVVLCSLTVNATGSDSSDPVYTLSPQILPNLKEFYYDPRDLFASGYKKLINKQEDAFSYPIPDDILNLMFDYVGLEDATTKQNLIKCGVCNGPIDVYSSFQQPLNPYKCRDKHEHSFHKHCLLLANQSYAKGLQPLTETCPVLGCNAPKHEDFEEYSKWTEFHRIYFRVFFKKTPESLFVPDWGYIDMPGAWRGFPVSYQCTFNHGYKPSKTRKHDSYSCNGKAKIFKGGKIWYYGNVVNFKMDGFGVRYYMGGANTIQYAGYWKNDKPSGDMTEYYRNGKRKFVGKYTEWKFKDGKEYYKDSQHIKWEGRFDFRTYVVRRTEYYDIPYEKTNLVHHPVHGKPVHMPTEIFPQKTSYSGQFKGLLRCDGDGISYYESGNRKYSGGFNDNCFYGNGILYDDTKKNLKLYEGEFWGKHNGTGIRYYKGSERKAYEGHFKRGNYDGYGTLYFDSDGEVIKYKGSFKYGKFDGDGTLYGRKPHDIINQGRFRNGQFVGGTWIGDLQQMFGYGTM